MILPNAHAIFLLLLTPVTFYLFTRDRIPISTTALGLLATLVVAFSIFPYTGEKGTVRPAEIFANFGNEALVAICALMVLGRGLTLTGALEPVARFVIALWVRSRHVAMLFVLMLCMGVSGLLNDTPIVVLMIPILRAVADRTKTPASKLLLPMNNAVLIGGMATTIGTSTNILVVSIAVQLGLKQFGIFEFTQITALAALPALAYLWLVAPRLLPDLGTDSSLQELRLYDAWLHVSDDSGAIGKTLRDIHEKGAAPVRVLEIKRGDTFLMRLPTLSLETGDALLVRDSRANLKRLSNELKMPLHSVDENEVKEHRSMGGEAADLQLAELVVAEHSALVGSTIRAARLAEEVGLIVLGLRAGPAAMATKPEMIGSKIIHAGDVLLVQGTEQSLEKVKHTGEFLVLDGAMTLPRSGKAPLAIATMLGVVLAASTGLMHISIAALLGVLVMLVTKCIKWEDIGESVSGRVILIVAASLALGSTMTVTGATDFLASAYLAVVRDLSPQVVLSSLMLLMAVLTNFVSNNAAAAIGTPVAFSIATQLGVSPEPFVLAVLFGANLCYLTPMGYQTNMLVMGAAGYRFKDFMITGFPLLIIMWAMYSWIVPKFYPFHNLGAG
jgi:di/tricarboxylate transporter